jgi:methionyl-tRNA synthetase
MKVLSAVACRTPTARATSGHVAGFGVPSDVFSRYMRMAGHDVLMVSGSDEHGTPILVLADQAEVTPREFVDTNHAVIAERAHRPRLLLRPLHAHDDGQPLRRRPGAVHPGVENGYMVEQTTQGAISPSTGRTLPDRYIEGTCPICGLRRGRGRPVRQLRQPARPDRPHRPAQPDQR